MRPSAIEVIRGVQVALICNAANSAVSWAPRLAGAKTAVNVDGLERKRRKWNALGRAWYRLGEWLSTRLPDAIVTDALCIQRYYREQYGKESCFIPYGASPPADTGTSELERMGLQPRGYVLYVSRLEPENNALLVVRAFEKVRPPASGAPESGAPVRLALVGDAPYAADYIARLRETRDERIVLPGAVYGKGYHQLRAHALLYVHATEVGGTHPALVEAMAAGLPVLYLDTPENREVAAEAGLPFASEDELAARIEFLLANAAERQRLGRLAGERARRLYDWEEVTSAYERLFAELLRK